MGKSRPYCHAPVPHEATAGRRGCCRSAGQVSTTTRQERLIFWLFLCCCELILLHGSRTRFSCAGETLGARACWGESGCGRASVPVYRVRDQTGAYSYRTGPVVRTFVQYLTFYF